VYIESLRVYVACKTSIANDYIHTRFMMKVVIDATNKVETISCFNLAQNDILI